ncbi:shikimate dehydrogenase [Bacillus infantis]|uniref:shikimate dehydrogenase n=1 Tax=Bacillus infantis TaxID=324767 RepID=UPI000B9A1CD5|nr:shikimate dehydrogenase [Bacillus infantis]MCR6612064.1 shikimate dehydrogenase [Bacillus infantis]OXT19036.1 shikimate dehydrogenase [Bacillus sp. OG2]
MKKLFAVIGDPIGHSMSPAMHNDLFNVYGLDACYVPLKVSREDLGDAVKGLRAIGIAGFNVTVPHKTEIMPFLDEIDPLAEAIGAVNTVLNKDGKLIGCNTDGEGYVRGLASEVPDFSRKKILIAGAGGAARAIYYTLAQKGVQAIDISNRTAAKAEALADKCPFPVRTDAFGFQQAEEKLAEYDIIIQTTPIGMLPGIDALPFGLYNLKANAFVSDIIYNPLETKFLREAKNKGASIQNGLKMFVFQGALAFERWTGTFPDTDRMEAGVITQLGGQTC